MKSKKELMQAAALIMEDFNFEEVQAYMKLVNWQWMLPSGTLGVPDTADLSVCARDLLTRAIEKEGPCSIGTGGFMVYKFDHGIELIFYVTRTFR